MIPAVLRALDRIDIYWLDQLLKGRIQPGMKILDAGCGGGRNVRFLLEEGYQVFGIDRQAPAIEALRQRSCDLGLESPGSEDRFKVGRIEALPWEDATFDVVLASAVLHFAPDIAAFDQQLAELWRVLNPGGLFFARLASDIGIEGRVSALGDRRYRLPDGSERLLVDEAMLLERQRQWHADLLEPIKTTNVQGLRCMTTWVLSKPVAAAS